MTPPFDSANETVAKLALKSVQLSSQIKTSPHVVIGGTTIHHQNKQEDDNCENPYKDSPTEALATDQPHDKQSPEYCVERQLGRA
jgi:hypothetical protein